jgi:(S)-ureidoglycine aminohydrolase
MLRRLFFILCCISAFDAVAQTYLEDTLKGQVCEWDHLQRFGPGTAKERLVLVGATHDLSNLAIYAYTLGAHGTYSETLPEINQSDELIIVKEGTISVPAGAKNKVLGPGGVGLIRANDRFDITNSGKTDAIFYGFFMRSRNGDDSAQKSASPFLMDWPEMPMKKTDKGESRQIFDRPATSLKRIDMHATTLDSGQISHPPHVHRAEEIILMRSGRVKVFIGGNYYDAKGGDLIFFPSGVPHNIENKGKGRCEYFALQWEP